ncbi:MAG: hypothetical protein JSV59_11175 [Flavobacteriaceae bacterium]|nr:MAG: hypothetical protein JSV59_11175 [Flavobacteriaceae bacterium]
MINFFRRIRKNLSDDNKPLKYMKYAIGEILLVVIGILIALQVNNWNEDRKSEILEIKVLKRLRQDLVADTLYLNDRLQRTINLRAEQYEFVHEIYNTQKSEKEFRKVLGLQNWDSDNLVMQISTYEELKSSGQINILENEGLKIQVIDLYHNYEVATKHFEEINGLTSREFLPGALRVGSKYYFSDIYDEERLMEGTDWRFINDPTSESFKILEDTQMMYNMKYGYFIGYFENLLTKSKSLIKNIDNELQGR